MKKKHIFYHHERFGTHFDNYARKVVDEHKFYFCIGLIIGTLFYVLDHLGVIHLLPIL